MQLTPEAQKFVTDYHLATLSTYGPDGTIHVVPVGFTLVDGVARVIAGGGSQKVLNIRRNPHATLSQVDGARWITLVGSARIETDAASIDRAVELYAGRYRQPQPNPQRVAILIEVQRIMGSAGMVALVE